MLPLHLPFLLTRIKTFVTSFVSISVLGIALSTSAMAQDQKEGDAVPPAKVNTDTIIQPAPPIKFRERPKYVSDTQRLRRTPIIDGSFADGEWDPFYTIDDAAIKGTVYLNWDDRYLYLAAKTDAASTVLFDIDAGGDGWLRGSDNMELVVGPPPPGGGAPSVSVRLLDAANSKDTPTWNETGVDPKTIITAEKTINGVQFLEVAIPKNTGSIVLRPGVSIGLRAEFMPPIPAAAYLPTQAFEPHLLVEATLVEARVVAAQGLNPKLTLSDYKCVSGQKLFATLELYNQTDLTVKIKSVLWSGQGNSVNAVNTLREVNIQPVIGLKRNKLEYKTVLPNNLALGSYILTVVVETEDGKRIESAASFAVVEPIQVQMNSEPQPVAILGPTKLTVNVDVQSAVPDHWRGDVELVTYPPGWEITNGKRHSLLVDRQDHHGVSHFDFKLPSNTAAGSYPIEATVMWKGRTWRVRTTVIVIRTDAPGKPPEPAPPTGTL